MHAHLRLHAFVPDLLCTITQAHSPAVTALDLRILNRVHAHATPGLTLLAKSFSFLGSPHTLWPTIALVVLILWLRRFRPQAVFLATSLLTSGLLESLVKVIVRRPRPTVPWAYVSENTFSFPSGHATLAVALYGTIIWLTRDRPPAQRIVIAALSLMMTLAIGLSRLYLGAHNPTDVLAGYLTGALALIFTARTLQYRPSG